MSLLSFLSKVQSKLNVESLHKCTESIFRQTARASVTNLANLAPRAKAINSFLGIENCDCLLAVTLAFDANKTAFDFHTR